MFVIDGFGAGSAPDAELFGDSGACTYCSVRRFSAHPVMDALGMGWVVGNVPEGLPGYDVNFFLLNPSSPAKDTFTGHLELLGVIRCAPPKTYEKFPRWLVKELEMFWTPGFLYNGKGSGTELVRKLGGRARAERKMILYTSADSVLQLACHTSLMEVEEFHRWGSGLAEKLKTLGPPVDRLILRPYEGNDFAGYRRIEEGRKDFVLSGLPSRTVLPVLKRRVKVVGFGKVVDILGDECFSEVYRCSYEEMWEALKTRTFEGGFYVANFWYFDQLYGHRRDVKGYSEELSRFENYLLSFLNELRCEDLLLITGDHGCDPAYTATTDHTRERVPLIAVRRGSGKIKFCGEKGFSYLSELIAAFYSVEFHPWRESR